MATKHNSTVLGALLAGVAVCAAPTADAIDIEVSQGGELLGTVQPFTTTLADLSPGVGAVFFSLDTAGLGIHFAFQSGGTGAVRWKVTVTEDPESRSDPSVIVSDDEHELRETADDVFLGHWRWQGLDIDGGAIGPLERIGWAIEILPQKYEGLTELRLYDGEVRADEDGYIPLALDTGKRGEILFVDPVPVPEPATLALLGLGLAGLGLSRRRVN